jgi:predicted nucleic acid-binding protein
MPKITIRLGRLTIPLRCAEYFLDANLLTAFHVKNHSCHRAAELLVSQLLLLRERGKLALWVSPLVVSEVWWAVLGLLYDEENGKGAWRSLNERTRLGGREQRNEAKRDRERAIERHIQALAELTEFVLSPEKFDVAELGPQDVRRSFGNIEAYSLTPQDALHCSVMQSRDVTGIVTNDRDFESLPWVEHRIRFDYPLS